MGSISKNVYQSLTKSRVNAWAIWDEKFSEKEKPRRQRFEEVAEYLNPNVIFLGLNPSKDLFENNLINFHSGSSNDKKLKKAVQGDNKDDAVCPNLLGGFMTDIVVDESVADSTYIVVKDRDTKRLEEKLNILGQKEYHLICFGNKAYNAVQSWLLQEKEDASGILYGQQKELDLDINIYRVVHFAATVKTEKFINQLKTVDRLVMSKNSL